MQVVWSPSSLREVRLIFDDLAYFNPRAAAEVFTALIDAGDDFAIFPQRGRRVGNGEMREIMTSYPYIIRYRVAADTVRILRVRHAARQPTIL
jgi:toxin ParE1/3/4